MIDQRINQLQKRIKQHPGNDSDLRDRLQKLRQRRMGGAEAPGDPTAERTPTPWSGAYESTVGSLGRNRDNTLLGLEQTELETKKRAGFDNTSDPFSRANQLQQNFANANRGTLNNYAAAGQLYSGSLNNARDIDRTNFERGWDSERKAYQDQLATLAQRRLDATTDYDEGVLEAEADRLADAAEERVDPAEAPPAGDGKGDRNKKDKKDNKGKKGKGK